MRNNETNPGSAMPQDNASAESIQHFVEAAHAVDLATWFAELPRELATEQILALDLPRRAKTFSYLPFDIQAEFVRQLERRELAEIAPMKPEQLTTPEALSELVQACKRFPDIEMYRRLDEKPQTQGADDVEPTMLSWEEMREMQASGLIEFGSHTENHCRLLETLEPGIAEHEILASKQRLEEKLDREVEAFCYPNGDVSSHASQLVAEHYKVAVTTQRGINRPDQDAMQLKRIGVEQLTVVADVGYRNGEHGADCEAAGITAVVPSPKLVNPKGDFFDKSRFSYEPEHDRYRCPAGALLKVYKTDYKAKVRQYSSPACEQCALKPQCTKSRRRTINRHFYTDQVEAMNRRTVAQPALMRQRSCLSEHPFGTIKRMTDNGQFLMRGLEKVKAEMGLSMLSYNLKRVINILGVETLCARLAT